MAEKKNQHYVPQSYLKLFSTDKKNIGIYTISNDKTTLGPINKQASKKYFYSKDMALEIENALQEVENLGIDSFKKIINHNGYKWEIIEYLNAYVFIIIQYARTLYAVQKFQEQMEDNFLKYFYLHSNLNEIDPNLVFKIDSPTLWALKIYGNMLSCCLDLKYKILSIDKKSINEKFMTSDNPVCIFNPYLEVCNNLQNDKIALGHKGIIILLTISPQHAIIIYDADVYKIGNRREWFNITNPKDVSIINKIVAVNANEVLYYRQTDGISPDLKNFAYKLKRNNVRKSTISSFKGNCTLSFMHFLSKTKSTFNLNNITPNSIYRKYTLFLYHNPHVKECLDSKWGASTEEDRKLFYKKLNERYMVYKNLHNEDASYNK